VSIRIATWNIRTGGSSAANDRTDRIVEFVQDFEILVLTEFQQSKPRILKCLEKAGWEYLETTGLGKERGVLVASRVPITRVPHFIDEGEHHARRLDFTVNECNVHVSAIYAPTDDRRLLEQKQLRDRFWGGLFKDFLSLRKNNGLLLGDFNIGCKRRDIEPGSPFRFSCADRFDALGGIGWIDLWRKFHPDQRSIAAIANSVFESIMRLEPQISRTG